MEDEKVLDKGKASRFSADALLWVEPVNELEAMVIKLALSA